MTLVVKYLLFKHFIEQPEVIWFIKSPDCFLTKPWGSDLVKADEGKGAVLLSVANG